MKKFIFLILFSSLVSARTFPHIKDPLGILERLDQFEERAGFDVFQCGGSILYERHRCGKFCEPFTCKEVCDKELKTEDITITDCTLESVSFSSFGKVDFVLTKKELERFSHLRYFLSAPFTGEIESPNRPIGKNYIVMDGADPETFTLENGKSLKALRIKFSYYHWDETTKHFDVSKQSSVYGKARETFGLFLEHKIEGYAEPISRAIAITHPESPKTR